MGIGSSTEGDAHPYRGGHQPNNDGPPAWDLLAGGGEWGAPPDIYDHPEYYGTRGPWMNDTVRVLRSIRGKPTASVTIYRSVPHGVTSINPGDWVTLSRHYAKQHGLHPTDPKQDWPVISKSVPAKDVKWAGDDLTEFGYFPGGAARRMNAGSRMRGSAWVHVRAHTRHV